MNQQLCEVFRATNSSEGIVEAMLFYNIAAALLFLSLRYFAGMPSIWLLPVSGLHFLLGAWCFISLRSTGRSDLK
jgi:hypothetical protein